MKKPLIIVICLALLVAFATAATAGDKNQLDVYDRQELVKSVVFVIGSNEYFVNGETPGKKMDAEPFIENSRTFVPIRYLSNALGVVDKHIGWESPTVTLDQPGMPVVELAVGSKEIVSDDQAETMDVAPLLTEGRTYLPARWVAEALGYEVAWDGENNVVLCYPKGTEKPDIDRVIDYIGGETPQEPVEEQPDNAEAVEFDGEPLDPNDYEVAERKAIPHEFTKPGASRMDMTVEELRQNPVMMGEGNGYKTIYDVDVRTDMVYVKQDGSARVPAILVLAKGNDVSVQRANTLKEYSSNPFTHGYYVSLDADPGGGTKIEDVTHIMLLYSNQALAIKNPLYKGDN
ncbi:MAG: copper amine oxidase N-terminal domain-containing protein [Firmicutes bacterium]|nr:copper amine oxidase N-terminal domain-containing protein [Bacillota bacterium]